MSLRSPFYDFFDAINQEVDSFNNRYLGDLTRNKSLVKPNSGRVGKWLSSVEIIPPVDLIEHNDYYEIHASIPGVKNGEDINLELHEDKNEVVISGNVPARETEENRDGWRIKECASGSFTRVVELPPQPKIDPEKIEASYNNGVLTLKLQKLPPAERKKVHKIQIASS
ncbi:HCL571Cp [Eremothecium sinecaudum]|uniref:HCL571Cp n=1 Tax=Eremothecium sinecaudum TaxID=45286 RepID=A0A109UY05_9SACH|nr:HCL571Cp [Eremothecium sinecaudum]AMD19580.1 HCL571Cp [Eremothecium sinecaudum]